MTTAAAENDPSADLPSIRRQLDRLAFARLVGLTERQEAEYQALALREAQLVGEAHPRGRWFSRAS